jgi:hypothetical protein
MAFVKVNGKWHAVSVRTDDTGKMYYDNDAEARVYLSEEEAIRIVKDADFDHACDCARDAAEDALRGTGLEVNGDGDDYDYITIRITVKPKEESKESPRQD